MTARRPRDRGAAAVEFALVFPVLVLMSMIAIGFTQGWFMQTVANDAANQAVRHMAISDHRETAADPRYEAVQIALKHVEPYYSEPGAVDVGIMPFYCEPDPYGPVQDTTAVVTLHDYPVAGGLWKMTLEASATMRCQG